MLRTRRATAVIIDLEKSGGAPAMPLPLRFFNFEAELVVAANASLCDLAIMSAVTVALAAGAKYKSETNLVFGI